MRTYTSTHPDADDGVSAEVTRVNSHHQTDAGVFLPSIDLDIGDLSFGAFLTEEQLASLRIGLGSDALAMVPALAWYYGEIYDGPECVRPEWVTDAEESLGEHLAPGGGLRDRTEAVQHAVHQYNKEED